MPAPAEPSPLAATLARAAAVEGMGFGIVVERRTEPARRWVPADSLGAALEDALDSGAEVAGGLRHVAAAWMVERGAWLASALLALTLLAERRVPDLRPDNVLIRFQAGVPYGLALRSDRMTVLAGDPAAGAPDVSVADDLVARARSELIALLEPLVEALTELRLRPRRALWRAAGDRLVEGCLWAGAALDRDDAAIALARELMAEESPLRVPVRVETRAGSPYHERATCCLAYRIEGTALCLGCPLARRDR